MIIAVALVLFVVLVGFLVWHGFIKDTRPKFPTKPGQDALLDAVWHDIFGIEPFTWWKPKTWKNRVPAVDWFEARRLDWKNKAWTISWDPDGAGPLPCNTMHVAGLSPHGANYVQVAYPDGTKSFHSTALVHELGHRYLELKTGDGNAAHTDPVFLPGGIVSKGEDLVVKMGL